MTFVFEGDVGQFELAVAFNEDALWAVYQNIVDGFVFQQGLQRAEAHDLVIKLLVDGDAIVLVEDDVHFVQRFACDGGDFGAQAGFGRGFKRGQIEAVQQTFVQFELDVAQAIAPLAVLVHGNGLRRRFRGSRGLHPRRWCHTSGGFYRRSGRCLCDLGQGRRRTCGPDLVLLEARKHRHLIT
ncbi:hypothetical protein GALL_499450 [mine drainage metagenome]|uniref:Uncharacterized protein n=1 Tax=mine drainage metagenome TaxID=410659 RepID=A0A1J5PCH9_9ZZZZ